MQQGLDFGFSDEQVSTLVGICRAVHTSAVAERHALEASVKHCNALLLAHSIDRPPQSVAIFSLHDMRRAAEWFSASYFMHYSMYQYVFTPQVTLSFTAKDPRELIELPVPLPPLQDALEEAEHAAQQAAAAEKRAQEAAEAQAEACPCPRTSAPFTIDDTRTCERKVNKPECDPDFSAPHSPIRRSGRGSGR